MNRSGSQKVLLVISIIAIVGGIVNLLLAIMAFAGGGFLGALDASDAASLTAETGLSQVEAAGFMLGLGVMALPTALVGIIKGILGIRASKDATKIGPVRLLTICSLVLAIAGIALSLFGGNTPISELSGDLGQVVFNVFMLWICNNIKNQASYQ